MIFNRFNKTVVHCFFFESILFISSNYEKPRARNYQPGTIYREKYPNDCGSV